MQMVAKIRSLPIVLRAEHTVKVDRHIHKKVQVLGISYMCW